MLINYGSSGSEPYSGGGFRWFLITIPLLLYICANILLLYVKPKVKKNPIIIFLVLYLLMSLLSSAIHSDLKHFSEVARWVLPIIFITHFRVKFPLALLNLLYLLALITVILTFQSGIDFYGYLPGQTIVNLHQGMWWRISIWKYITPPYSAAFSLIVFFANYFLNKRRSRFFFYALTIYFILLSGNRTSYLIFVLCLSLVYFHNLKDFKFNRYYAAIPILGVGVIFGLQLAADLIPLLGIQNEFFNSAILRNDSAGGGATNLSSRFLIIIEHIKLIQDVDYGIFLGIGSKIYTSLQWSNNGGGLGGSTDSYISHLIVRDGFGVLFSLLAFISFFIESMKEKNMLGYVILLSLLLYTVGYGAWLNLTSPVFVLFLGFMYHSSAIPPNQYSRLYNK
jgi:hypothetical protein